MVCQYDSFYAGRGHVDRNFAPQVLYECGSCENRRFREKLCLTVTRNGVVQDRCAQCILGHKKCEWKKGDLKANQGKSSLNGCSAFANRLLVQQHIAGNLAHSMTRWVHLKGLHQRPHLCQCLLRVLGLSLTCLNIL